MGWFFSQQSNSEQVVEKCYSADTLHRLECKACPRNKAGVYTPKMSPSGTEYPLIYVLGDAPNGQADRVGEPLAGKSGDLLRDLLRQTFKDWVDLSGGDENSVFRFNNVIRTHPEGNATPGEIDVECCKPSITRDIEQSKPLLILALGGIPLNWLLLPVYKAKLPYRIGEWRGRIFPVQVGSHVCWVAPVFSPDFVISSARGNVSARKYEEEDDNFLALRNDLTRIREHLFSAGDPVVLSRDAVDRVIDDFELISGDVGDKERFDDAISYFHSVDCFAFDIETASGEATSDRKVRPFGKNARILSISLSDGDRTTSIALDHSQMKWGEAELAYVKKQLVELFSHTPRITKIAHNLMFELEWMIYLLKLPSVHNAGWADTMADAYVLDSRIGVLSLNALTRIWFGIGLKEFEPVDVANLDQELIEKVLRYNGVDSYFTFYLYYKQREKLSALGQTAVGDAQVARIPSFAYAQILGIPVSQDEVSHYRSYMETQRDDVLRQLQQTDPVREYGDRFGTFNPGSDSDVRKLLRDVLQRKEGFRGQASYSTDESVLSQIDLPVTNHILKYRQFAKLKSTYLEPLVSENKKFVWPDGKVHPAYKLAYVATRRTSSEFPNIQNQPKRRDKYIRSCFVAPENHLMVAVDYGQVEARVIAMASKDEYLVEALWNRYDIHQEWAIKIADLYPPALGKMSGETEDAKLAELRQETKNKLVFPAFYGAQAGSIGSNFDLPSHVVRRLLDEFWATFAGVKSWQDNLHTFYRSTGYVELLTGFRRYAPLEGNKIINSPVQGTASDIVVDAMNRCSATAEQSGDMQLQPRLNIHDDLTFFIKEDELDDRVSELVSIMLTPTFDFINVPLAVEITAGPDWYHQEDIAKVSSDEWFT